jgi:hypothetical protein
MWDPRRLTTLWASIACYRDSFTFAFLPITKNKLSDKISDRKCAVAVESRIDTTPRYNAKRSHAPSCLNPSITSLLSYSHTHSQALILFSSLSVLHTSYWKLSLFACLPSSFHCGHFSTLLVFEYSRSLCLLRTPNVGDPFHFPVWMKQFLRRRCGWMWHSETSDGWK